jgi:ubiquinone/menaquinone biosynthesis C-methylase UbiE
MLDYDSELRALHPHLRAAAAVSRGERVLDVGCGAGASTREAGRAAAPGPVLGVDVDAQQLERARALTAVEGPDNVTYLCADAQTHPFPPAGYDLAISRFGTMFFADPAAAFANLARALRADGRLALLVWQAHERNEWAVAIDRALGSTARLQAEEAFSLGDPGTVRRILEGAGFTGVRLEDVREPIFYGSDVAAALEFVGAFRSTRDALAAMAPGDADRALERLRRLLDEHHVPGDGVVFDSRVWLITGRRAS